VSKKKGLQLSTLYEQRQCTGVVKAIWSIGVMESRKSRLQRDWIMLLFHHSNTPGPILGTAPFFYYFQNIR